jgi:imidazolonepropionase-like amidohydrolase
LGWISAEGGQAHQILPTGGNSATVVTTPRDGERVYYLESGPRRAGVAFGSPPPMHLVSVKLDGTDKRTHAKISTGSGGLAVSVARPSPDGKSLLLLDRDNAYVMRLTEVGDGISVNLTSPSVPLTQVTNEGANTIGWVDEGSAIAWSFTNHYYRAPLETVIQADSIGDLEPEHFEISLSVPRYIPQGRLYLEGARIITMRGEEVIPEGDILIENNRIAAVGPSSSMDAPSDARVVDVRGKTIVPGFVDVHAHPSTGAAIAPDEGWNIANHLAYGVTTTRNPSGSRGSFWWAELIEAGEMVGSRVYATANPLTHTGTPIRSYEDALHVARRYDTQGAHSLKQYLQPRRIQRQWLRMAAEEVQINITNEGAADFKADFTMALDGFTAFEHSLGVVPLYKDAIEIFAQTGITYTPTLIVAYGGPAGEGYWRTHWNMHDDEKLRRFTPHASLDAEWRRKEVIVDEDYIFPLIAQGVRDIVRAGGRAGLGSHGNQAGMGAQWEIWMLASGGMTPMEVLQVVTIHGAESIGFERDLGSLEPGKLADLLVLDANPLDDIRNTNAIRYVIKNGVMHDGDTLDELWPRQRAFPKFPWTIEDEAFERLRR